MIEVFENGYGEDKLAEMDLGKKIMDRLIDLYPGHNWFVDVNRQAGVATVQLMYKNAQQEVKLWKWGYLLHIKNILDFEKLQEKVMLAGGEMLERYKLARGAATAESEILASLHGLDVSNSVN